MNVNPAANESQYISNILMYIHDNEQNRIIHSTIDQLKVNPNIVAIYLYGSYTRSEQKPYSDIDIAVITSTLNPVRKDREWIGSYSSKKLDIPGFFRSAISSNDGSSFPR